MSGTMAPGRTEEKTAQLHNHHEEQNTLKMKLIGVKSRGDEC